MQQDKRTDSRSKITAVLFLMVLLIVSAQALAAESGAIETITVTITQTTEDDFTCEAGLFRITKQTTVFDEQGALSGLGYIDLPCRARVTYEASATDPQTAIRVNVLESLRALTPAVPE